MVAPRAITMFVHCWFQSNPQRCLEDEQFVYVDILLKNVIYDMYDRKTICDYIKKGNPQNALCDNNNSDKRIHDIYTVLVDGDSEL